MKHSFRKEKSIQRVDLMISLYEFHFHREPKPSLAISHPIPKRFCKWTSHCCKFHWSAGYLFACTRTSPMYQWTLDESHGNAFSIAYPCLGWLKPCAMLREKQKMLLVFWCCYFAYYLYVFLLRLNRKLPQKLSSVDLTIFGYLYNHICDIKWRFNCDKNYSSFC